MKRSALRCTPLPHLPLPFPGELLSSWLRRTGSEFGVSLQTLAQHFELSQSTAIDIDQDLSTDDVQRLAIAMRSEPEEIRQAMHHRLRPEVRALRATRAPVQVCSTCRSLHQAGSVEPVFVKAWFEFWEIECGHCRTPLSSPGGPRLRQCNPAREMPHWFAQILPAARVGADRLRAFAQWPHNTALSRVAILCLMSRSIGPDPAQPEAEASFDDGISGPEAHRMAEQFVSGLHELSREDLLLPTAWSEPKPVRLVTARTILLAAMARFSDDPQGSLSLILGASLGARQSAEWWFSGLPSHSQDFLAGSRGGHVPSLSKDCSIFGKRLDHFSQV